MTRADKIYWLSLFVELFFHQEEEAPFDEMTHSALVASYICFCKANGLAFTTDPEENLYRLRMEASHSFMVTGDGRICYFKRMEDALEFSETINGTLSIIN